MTTTYTRYKDTDQTVNNSSTLVNDDKFTFPVGANEAWGIECWLLVQSVSDADFKFSFTAPSGATKYFSAHPTTNLTLGSPTGGLAASSGNYSVGTTYDLDAVPVPVLVKAVVINGATAGDVTLQWGQYTADNSDTKVLKGSYLVAARLD